MVTFDVTDCPDPFNLSNLMKKSSSFSVALSTIIGTNIAPVPPPKFILIVPKNGESTTTLSVTTSKFYQSIPIYWIKSYDIFRTENYIVLF